jgi:chorismate mutase-like protein
LDYPVANLIRRFSLICSFVGSFCCLILTPLSQAAPLHDDRGARRIDSLFELIESRLAMMEQVAAYKYANKLAIEDSTRETQVLEAASNSALAYGLTPASSRFFFALQIEAAKEVQRYWFEQWSDSRPITNLLVSLDDELRPRLNALGDAIVKAIDDTYPITDKSLATQFVRAASMSKVCPTLPNMRCFEPCLRSKNFPISSTRF